MMQVTTTALEGVLLVDGDRFGDDRGFFTEVYHREKFAALGLPTEFVQDNHSRSVRHTLRGLHYQVRHPQGKLVRVVRGAVLDVVVDVRRSSPQFGRSLAVRLDEDTERQLWVPPGFAHGFLVLSPVADLSYKCTTLYDAGADRAIRWNDPTLSIDWPLDGSIPILSAKDAAAPLLDAAELLP